MKSIVVIPARYGSTRLPGKALLDIAGKSLIQRVYERAGESTLADEVIVATDDERIRDGCLSFGAPVVMTSPDCRSGTDRVHEALRGRDADIVVNLQGDEPQIRGDMIDTLVRAMTSEASFEGAAQAPVIALDMATLCSYITEPHDYKSPHVAKIGRAHV
jgi:3-deoxy-D-manno-octulosonate cytidylyltransferase